MNGRFTFLDASLFVGGGFISAFRSRTKGKGYGKELMRYVCRLADQVGTRLELTACPFETRPMSTFQLVRYYRRFGFSIYRVYGERAVHMYREPVKQLTPPKPQEN